VNPVTEQAAFADWLASECPSGDVEAVQYQWAQSSDRADWLAEQEAAANPNTDMIRRDGEPQTFEQLVAQLVGNGCIFGAPRVERCNLLTVADIPRNGFSVWGAQ
jgi:hypothetical protein